MRSHRSNGSPVALPDIDPSAALVQAMYNEGKHRALYWQKRQIDVLSIGRCSIGARKVAARIRNWAFTFLLILLFLPLCPASSLSQVACKPFLSIKSVREVRASSPPALPWRWNATIIADASYC